MNVTIEPLSALIVDDDPVVARLVARLLSRQGYKCETFFNPLHALAELRERSVDVIVSDLRMPTMDGITFLKECMSLRPEAATVMLTGFADPETEEQAKQAGVDAFLSKTASEDQFETCLAEAHLHKTVRLASGVG